MDVKEIFAKAEGGALTYEQFEQLAKEAKANFADLSTGNYVSKSKYDDDIKTRDTTIDTLNGNITKRDDDLKALQKQLKEAGDDKQKVTDLTDQLSKLQTSYDDDTAKLKTQLEDQANMFAARDYANTKQFTSKAAKRDFTNSLIAKKLKLEDGKLVGADDFAKAYSEENEDAFVPENKDEGNPNPPAPQFQFTGPTPGPTPPKDPNAFNFDFIGVRERPKN